MKNIDSIYVLTFIFPLTSAIILFSKAHVMICFNTRNFKLQQIFITWSFSSVSELSNTYLKQLSSVRPDLL